MSSPEPTPTLCVRFLNGRTYIVEETSNRTIAEMVLSAPAPAEAIVSAVNERAELVAALDACSALLVRHMGNAHENAYQHARALLARMGKGE